MTTSSDDLGEELLHDVALAGQKGIGAQELERAIRTAHCPRQPSQSNTNVVDGEDGTSLSIPGDEDLLDTIWTFLEQHPDVEIKDVADGDAKSDHVANDEVSRNSVVRSTGASTSKHAGKRIFATANRMWHTITGHGIDVKRVPPMEFHLLSIIAAHGPEGILQPDVTKYAQQDKRSVPKRTDDLAAKGYITKDKVIIKGQQTTILTLRRFVQQAVLGPRHVRAFQKNERGTKPMIYYNVWFDECMRMLKENGGIIALQDLRVGLKIHGLDWARKALQRCADRLLESGLIRKLKVKVEPQPGEQSKETWVNCIQLLRDPTDADRVAFAGNYDSERSIRLKKEYRKANKKGAKEFEDESASDKDSESGSESEDQHTTKTRHRNEHYSFRRLEKQHGVADAAATPSPAKYRTGIAEYSLVWVEQTSELDEWGFTKLHSKVLMDKTGHLCLVGGPAAARNPFKQIVADLAGSDEIEASPASRRPRSQKGRGRSSVNRDSTSTDKTNSTRKGSTTTDVYRKVYQTKAGKRMSSRDSPIIDIASSNSAIGDSGLAEDERPRKKPRIQSNKESLFATDISQGSVLEGSGRAKVEAVLRNGAKEGVVIDLTQAVDVSTNELMHQKQRSGSKIVALKSDQLTERNPNLQQTPTKKGANGSSGTAVAQDANNNQTAITTNGKKDTPKKRGRPTKAMVEERERLRLTSLSEKQVSSTFGPDNSITNDSFHSKSRLETAEQRGTPSPLASKDLAVPISTRPKMAAEASSQSQSISETTPGSSRKAAVSTSSKKRKRGRPSLAELAERKRLQLGGSLIVKLPLRAELLLQIVTNATREKSDQNGAEHLLPTADSKSGPKSNLPVKDFSPSVSSVPQSLEAQRNSAEHTARSVGLTIETDRSSASQQSSTGLRDNDKIALEEERERSPNDLASDSIASVLHTPAARGKGTVGTSIEGKPSTEPVVHFTETRPSHSSVGHGEGVDKDTPVPNNEASDSDGDFIPPQKIMDETNTDKNPSDNHGGIDPTTSTSHIRSSKCPRFPTVEGITVRRTAEGIAAINAEILPGSDSSDEIDGVRKRRKRVKKTIKTKTIKRQLDILNMCTSRTIQEAIRSLLMSPCQIVHDASGTIGTIGSIESFCKEADVLENAWKKYHNAPTGLEDILRRAEQLDLTRPSEPAPGLNDLESEVEYVRLWENGLVENNCFIDLGGGRIFINHGQNLSFPPSAPYPLQVQEFDFISEFNVSLRRIQAKAKADITILDATNDSPRITRQSTRDLKALLPRKASDLSKISGLDLPRSSGRGLLGGIDEIFQTEQSPQKFDTFANGFANHPGSDVEFLPSSANYKHPAVSGAAEEDVFSPGAKRVVKRASIRRAKSKATASDDEDTGSSQSFYNVSQPPGDSDVTPQETDQQLSTNLMSLKPFNLQEQKCTSCQKRNKSCIAGSRTEKCALCKRSRTLCSKVDHDLRKMLQLGRISKTDLTYSLVHEDHEVAQAQANNDSQLASPEPPRPSSEESLPERPTPDVTNSVFKNLEGQARTETHGKRKRKYTYKAKEIAKLQGVDKPEEMPDHIDSWDRVRATSSSTTRQKNIKRFSPSDVERLSIVAALFRLLRPDNVFDTDPDWDIIASALGTQHDKKTLVAGWKILQTEREDFIERLQSALSESLLVAYENQEISNIDPNNLTEVDWSSLIQWVVDHVLPLQDDVAEADGSVPMNDLPASREALKISSESIPIPTVVKNTDKGLQANASIAHQLKPAYDSVTGVGHAEESGAIGSSFEMTLAKSMVRAVAITKEEMYDVSEAVDTLMKLNKQILKEATSLLERSRTIVRKKADRQLPGRNYSISSSAFSHFKRWAIDKDDLNFLGNIAKSWSKFMKHFLTNDQFVLRLPVSDADILVLTNMVNEGQLKIGLPNMTPEVRQKAAQMASTTDLTVVYSKTETFTPQQGIDYNVPIPSSSPECLNGAVPFWIDIHGNFLDEVWDMVLQSVLHCLVFQSGLTAREIENSHNGQLWEWEIKILLEWMETVGMARKIGVESGQGWTANDSWYRASFEAAAWQTPMTLMDGEV